MSSLDGVHSGAIQQLDVPCQFVIVRGGEFRDMLGLAFLRRELRPLH